MTTLKSSYPFGEQLSLEVTPDGRRAFAAEGAAITVLNLENLPIGAPAWVIQKIPVPEAQPLALAYFHDPGPPSGDHLFIAGGSLGLWRLALCPCLFASAAACCPPSPTCTTCPQPCDGTGSCPQYTLQLIDLIDSGAPWFERKRCVDVAIVQSEEAPILFALFASRSDAQLSGIGPTELVVYQLSGGSVIPITSTIWDVTPPGVSPVSLGQALAADPGVMDRVYVAMGKEGIWRVDLAWGPTPGLTRTQLTIPFCSGGVPTPCPPPSTYSLPCLQNARDIAILRSGTQAYLYGALSYGAVLEYDLTTPGPPAIECVCSYPERIAVATDGSGRALVAVAIKKAARAVASDSAAPFGVNGYWSGVCLEYDHADPDIPTPAPPDCVDSRIQFFEKDLAPPAPLKAASNTLTFGVSRGSLLLRPSGVVNEYRCYATSPNYRTESHKVTLTPGSPPSVTTQLEHSYVGEAFGAGDSVVSPVNAGIFRFGYEYQGSVDPKGAMIYIDTGTNEITVIPGTNSVCIGDIQTTGCSEPASLTVPACDDGQDPMPYTGNIFEEAWWADPADPNRTWVLAPKNALERYTITIGTPCTCQLVPDCTGTPLPWNPCPSSGASTTFHWRELDPLAPGFPATTTRAGWWLIRMTLPSAGSTNVAAMDLRWRQIVAPIVTSGPQQEVFARVSGYGGTFLDRRPLGPDGFPRWVYAVRRGTTHGLKIFKPGTLVAGANGTCPSLPASDRGFGEQIALTPADYLQAFTHIELEKDASGLPQCYIDACPPGEIWPKGLMNHSAEPFRIYDPSGGAHWILAVVVGFPAVEHQSPPGCLWGPYYGLPMVVFYDITNIGVPTPAPQLLRVALGFVQGHSFDVKVKTDTSTGRTYALVADVLGRLLSFDVSYDQLFPPPPPPPIPYLPLARGIQILRPVATIDFPVDPYDGQRTNCADLELDGNNLYCALARAGVGIVDVSNPASPVLTHVIDTPGLCLGIGTRTVPSPTGPVKQLIAGDSRCGVRVYQ